MVVTEPRRLQPLRAAPPESRRVGALDGIRGLAVAAVVAYHLDDGAFPGGFLGVDVFFVLSGYLITSLLVAEWERRGTVRLGAFWVRRVRRVIPLLLLTVAGVAVATPMLFAGVADRIRGESFSALAQGSNWFESFAGRSYFEEIGRASPLRHLWSLGVEVQFYVVWPLVAVLVLRRGDHRRLAGVAAAMAAASFGVMALAYRTGHDPSRLYYGTDTRIGTLLVGALVALLLPAAPGIMARANRLTNVIGVLGLIGLYELVRNADGASAFVYRGGFLLAALLTATLIAAVTRGRSTLARFLGIRPMRWLGTRSYAIYLWHWPVIVATVPGVHWDLRGAPLLVVRLAITAVLAEVSTRAVDAALRPPSWERGRIRRRIAFASAFLVVPAVGVATATTSSPSQASIIVSPTTTMAPTTTTIALPFLPPPTEVTTTTAPPPGPVALRGVAVGDSVMLAAGGEVQRAIGPGTTVNAAISRQPKDVLAALADERRAGRLDGIDVLVVAMGTNGELKPQDLDLLGYLAGGIPRVVAITVRVPRPWETASNTALYDGAKRLPWLRLADWHELAKDRTEWFAPDGVHPNREGARQYGDLVAAAARAP